ncbi:PAS domain S-box protein [Desulfurispira natronophila]|uniref:histidine kinase n=1 Tax=Desulfurispira natronophila TaxID=682562 RepID=A0A7W8DG52_9BACT|nr:PAS domain S-box protein [Desulfurispira natronophila]MBB5020868.1 PAS domain S-box-containing protein [Desulfurispira natronophila]
MSRLQLLHAILDNIPSATLCFDADGRVLYSNHTFQSLWGVDIVEGTSLDQSLALLGSQLKEPNHLIERLIGYLTSAEGETTLLNGTLSLKNGKQLHYRLQPLEHSEINGFLWIFENTSAAPYQSTLTHSLEYFYSLMGSMNELTCFYTLDISQRFGSIFGRWSRTMHMDEARYFASSIWQVFPPETARIHEKANMIVLQGKSISFDWSVHWGNEYLWFRSVHAPLLNDQHEVTGIFGFSVDITAQKKLEKEMRYQAEYTRNILNFQANMILVIDEYTIKTCNRAFLDFFKCHNLDEFQQSHGSIGSKFVKQDGYLSGDSYRWLDKMLENRSHGYESKVILYDIRRDENRYFMLDSRFLPGSGREIIITFTDITELLEYHRLLEDLNSYLEAQVEKRTHRLQRTNSELSKREQLISAIFDTSNIGIAVVNSKGVIQQCNEAFSRIAAMPIDELIGRGMEHLTHENLRDKIQHWCQRALEEAAFHMPREWTLQRHDNATLNLLVSIAPLLNDDPVASHVITISDITQQRAIENTAKHQEQMLIQQSKMADMGEMIGVIAHQWTQPLNTIGLLAQNLQFYHQSDTLEENNQRVHESLESIMNQVRFMAETIDDFRDFLTPSKTKKPFALDRAVESIIKLLRPQFEQSEIQVETHWPSQGTLLQGYGLPNEFKQVILNILVNARDAIVNRREQNPGSNPPSHITIRLENSEDHCELLIADSGGGIPEEIIESIFEPYMTTKGEQGTGIGLYMSRVIIEKHMGGSLKVSNEKEGASFVISLPLHRNPAVIGL